VSESEISSECRASCFCVWNCNLKKVTETIKLRRRCALAAEIYFTF
jgi:hypothetical protein